MMDLRASALAENSLSEAESRRSVNTFSSVEVKIVRVPLLLSEAVNTLQRDFITLRKALLHPSHRFSGHFYRFSDLPRGYFFFIRQYSALTTLRYYCISAR